MHSTEESFMELALYRGAKMYGAGVVFYAQETSSAEFVVWETLNKTLGSKGVTLKI